MIGEAEAFGRLHRGHMARGTGCALHYNAVTGRGMTGGAGRIVGRKPGFHGPVRHVATRACQLALACPEAATGSQQQRLMAGVPRIAKIGRVGSRRRTVAGSAQFVQSGAVEPSRMDGPRPRRISHVRRRWSVTVFTADTRFGRHDRAIRGQAYGTGRVAGETAQDCGLRVENPVADAARLQVPGGSGIMAELRVPALLVLEIVFPHPRGLRT